MKDRGPGQLHLVPEYKHLDGVSPLPDVPSTITCTSKAFAPGGEHGAYYLNEPRSQAKFAKDRNFSIVRLSAVKGSRQSTNVQLAIVAMGTVSTSNWELYPVPLPTTSNKQGPSKKPEGGAPTSMKGGEIHLTGGHLEGGVQSAKSHFKYSPRSTIIKTAPAPRPDGSGGREAPPASRLRHFSKNTENPPARWVFFLTG